MNTENVCQATAPIQLEVDKAALLANAKPLSSILTISDKAMVKAVMPEEAAINGKLLKC